jgi:TonB family protein
MGYAPQSGGPSMSSVSLHAIGVQSSRKTWTVIVAIAIALVAIGAVGAWLAMQGGERSEPVADAEPATPMEIGMPLPEGAEPPDVDFVSGGVRVTDQPQAGSGTKRTGGGGGGGTTTIGASSSGGTTGTTTGSGGAGGGAGGAGAGGASASAGGSAGGGGSGSGSAGGSGSGSGTASGTGTGDVPAGGTIPEGDLPEERDIALEMYASRVRFVIRRYYATRAQSCFDRATRNDPDLRGTVVVRFTIGSDGAVSGSSTIRNSTGNSELGACLANQVRSWRLPAPPGGDLTLEMPFSN